MPKKNRDHSGNESRVCCDGLLMFCCYMCAAEKVHLCSQRHKVIICCLQLLRMVFECRVMKAPENPI